MQHIIVDFEFTTIPRTNKAARRFTRSEIIEIGAVKVNDNYEIIDSFSSFVKPELSSLDPMCSRLTGITSSDLKDAPYFEQAADSFMEWIGEEEFIMYEWSNSDEIQFRGECLLKGLSEKFDALIQAEWIDIQKMFGDAVGISNAFSLEHALNTFNIIPEGRLHDAADDAYNTALLFGALNDKDRLDKNMKLLDDIMPEKKAHGSTLGDLFGDIFAELLPA